MSKLSAIIYFFLVLVTYPVWADIKAPKPVPHETPKGNIFAEVVEIDELMKQDIKDIKKDCPTCVFQTTHDFILNSDGTRQETAVVYVWYPGNEPLFIRSRHLIYNVVFVFLPNGTKDPELKKFLTRPPEVK
jgi:hypothetical protein